VALAQSRPWAWLTVAVDGARCRGEGPCKPGRDAERSEAHGRAPLGRGPIPEPRPCQGPVLRVDVRLCIQRLVSFVGTPPCPYIRPCQRFFGGSQRVPCLCVRVKPSRTNGPIRIFPQRSAIRRIARPSLRDALTSSTGLESITDLPRDHARGSNRKRAARPRVMHRSQPARARAGRPVPVCVFTPGADPSIPGSVSYSVVLQLHLQGE